MPAGALAYGWPLEPFDQVHAIRAYFDDPRLEGAQVSFHFGVDIQAPDGTPVFAVTPGEARLHAGGLAIKAIDGSVIFGYWHVVPEVASGALVVEGERIARIADGWGHVHLAERRGGRYLNPLRPGALEPYEDFTSPTIASISFSRYNTAVRRRAVSGAVDIAVDAYDTPAVRMGRPWAGTRVTPALIQWRILQAGKEVLPWRTAVDFRLYQPPDGSYDLVYAPGTVENRASRPGRYRFYLAYDWDSASLANGRYRLEVAAYDTRDNSARAGVEFTIAN